MPRSLNTSTFLKKFITLEILLIVVIVLWYVHRLYSIQEAMINDRLKSSGMSIDKALTDAFTSAESIMHYIGQLMVQKDHTLSEIYALLDAFDPMDNVKGLLTWSTIAWSDENFHLRVDSTLGIMTPPYKSLINRYDIYQSMISPWVLQIGRPGFGAVSKEKIIPTAMGVNNAQGEYLGSLFTGFKISSLKEKFQGILGQDHLFSFAIFDDSGEILFESDDHYISDYADDLISIYLRQLKEDIGGNNKEVTTLGTQNNIFLRPMRYDKLYIALVSRGVFNSHILSEVVRKTFFDLALIIGMCVIIMFFTRKFVIKPILELYDAAEHITSGDFKRVNIKHYSSSELEALASSLRKLMAQQFELLDINKKLEFMFSKAEAASNVKTEFIRHMQHEIRTPLNHIIGGAELLISKFKGQEYRSKFSEELEYCNMIHRSGKELLEMLTNIITVADFESGNVELSESKCSVEEIINDVLEQVYPRILQREIKLEKNIDTTLPPLLLDKEKIKVSLINLLNNSIKFSHHGGQIKIKAFQVNSGIIITISDTGEGIPQQDLNKIIEIFEYSGDLMKRVHKGIGLGLTIVQSFLELHDAKFEIQSWPNKGTEVTITIPNIRVVKEGNEHETNG